MNNALRPFYREIYAYETSVHGIDDPETTFVIPDDMPGILELLGSVFGSDETALQVWYNYNILDHSVIEIAEQTGYTRTWIYKILERGEKYVDRIRKDYARESNT